MSGQQKKFNFIIVLLFAMIVITLAGYFFAQKRSEPEFRNKIERIMFEKKNKAPKYILILPEKNALKPEPKEELPELTEHKKLETLEDFVKAAPLVAKLKESKNHYSLAIIDRPSDFVEKKGDFYLPKISPQGRKPWMDYGHQVNVAPNFYKVAVIFKNTGIDQSTFESMNMALPSEISFSFSPYTLKLKEFISKARKSGHETYMDLLLASKNVLKSDNGPLSMGVTVSAEENLRRLHTALAVDAPIGGMVVADGLIDETAKSQLSNYMAEFKQRGLLMIDATEGTDIDHIKQENLPRKKADIIISSLYTPEYIQEMLSSAEEIAQNKGQVLIVAIPKPIVITAIKNWVETFSPQLSYEQMKEQNITSIERPFALVPVSNLVVE